VTPSQRDAKKVLGPLEAAVMEVLWLAGEPMTVREVRSRIGRRRRTPPAYTTVMTVMARLEAQSVLTREKRGRGYAYEPTVADAPQLAVRGVLADFGDAALTGFVEEARADPKTMRRLKRLLKD
jgi:predicted transcriptional regulator